MSIDDGRHDNERVTDRLPDVGGDAPGGPGKVRPEVQVTDRLPDDSRINETHELDNSRVTDRLPGLSEPATPDEISHKIVHEPSGEIIAGRYRILEGPVGRETGEAQVFICRDLRIDKQVALKLYKANLSPKRQVMDRLLNMDHPGLVGLRDYGEWGSRFYEVQEYCRGGCINDIAPLTEKQLTSWLGDIVEGVHFCHNRGIVHRDIKPTNILFRDEGRCEPVIGDFGISSFLEEGQGEKKTKTYMFFTIDYCPPEQLRLREVGPAADYYSLGITLIHLLLGASPFDGLTEDEIVDCHLRGRVLIPDTVSEDFKKMLRGLLRNNPQSRWGYKQVEAWLRSEPVFTNEGTPDKEEVYFGQEIGYPEYPEAGTPVELAQNLSKFDAVNDLFRGKISLWVKLFDPEMAERIVEVEERYTDKPELGLFKLLYILDPSTPLKAGSLDIHDIPGLVQALKKHDKDVQSQLKDAFWDGRIETWIETVFQTEKALRLAHKIKDFRRRYVGRKQTGTLHLLFMLDPASPLRLGSGVSVAGPEELIDAMLRHEDVRDTVKAFLFSGQLAAWLEIAFPERQDAVAYVNEVAERYKKDRDSGLDAITWFFKPSLPFVFVGRDVVKPEELAELVDKESGGWEEGLRILNNDSLRIWLTATGMLSDPAAFDQVLANEHLSDNAKLEMILRLLKPDLERPVLKVDVEELDFGDIPAGSMKTLEVEFRNEGRGQLIGRLKIADAGDEITLDPPKLEGPGNWVMVTVRPPIWLSAGVVRNARIIAESNGGGLDIPVTYRVTPKIASVDMEKKNDVQEQKGGLFDWFSNLFK